MRSKNDRICGYNTHISAKKNGRLIIYSRPHMRKVRGKSKINKCVETLKSILHHRRIAYFKEQSDLTDYFVNPSEERLSLFRLLLHGFTDILLVSIVFDKIHACLFSPSTLARSPVAQGGEAYHTRIGP